MAAAREPGRGREEAGLRERAAARVRQRGGVLLEEAVERSRPSVVAERLRVNGLWFAQAAPARSVAWVVARAQPVAAAKPTRPEAELRNLEVRRPPIAVVPVEADPRTWKQFGWCAIRTANGPRARLSEVDQVELTRFLSVERCRTRCNRNRASSRSRRIVGSGSQIAGTRSRHDSSANTRASILSVLHANGANPLTFLASATNTSQPASSSVSRTNRAPFIDSITARTRCPRTRRASPPQAVG